MDTTTQGLMRPNLEHKEAGEMMSALRKAFGPSRGETLTLEQELERLTEERLKLVLNIAQWVKMASGWDETTPYHVLVERMYGKMDMTTKRLVAAILQDADPREEPETPAPDKRVAAREAMYEQMAFDFDTAQAEVQTFKDVQEDAVTPEPEQLPIFADEEGADAFLMRIAPRAIMVAQELGIDPRIVAAQAALETGWGKSVKGNNLFGIKSHGKADGLMVQTHEVLGGKRQKITDSFRQYESFDDSIEDYGLFLRENKRYQPMLEADTLEEQITALGRSGYATDPEYAKKIADIAKSKRLEVLVS